MTPTEDTPTPLSGCHDAPTVLGGNGTYYVCTTCGNVSEMIRQDDKHPNSKTYSFNVWKDGTIRPESIEAAQWLDNHANAIAKRKYAKQLDRKQLQLVTELIAQKVEAENVYEATDVVDVVPVSVLEHKKQELERRE